MAETISVQEFIRLADAGLPVADVRSPAEYAHAHIPGARNLPLFDNEERAEVGTLYKRVGKVAAVQRGLALVGPKLEGFTREALSWGAPEVLVHCWRGGMRSASMAWLLETVGLRVYLLEGGYKAYRHEVLDAFERPYRLISIGGFTGSGKTDLLKALASAGEQVLDLEGLACHKGSAFGAIGERPQPTTEHFEHLVYDSLRRMDPARRIWVEDESRSIGRVFIPQGIWNRMDGAPLLILQVPEQTRVQRLLRDYGTDDLAPLTEAIRKIGKRLGYDRCQEALAACEQGDLARAASVCLTYYDKFYRGGMESRIRQGKRYAVVSAGDPEDAGPDSLRQLAEQACRIADADGFRRDA